MKSVLELAAAPLLPGIVAAAVLVAPARADVVTDWNVITNALVAKDVGNNPKLRTLALVHVAMSDAINTVQNRYTRVIATLPVAQREALILVEWLGLGSEEAGRVLGIEATSVRGRVHRGRDTLRGLLGESDD